MSQVCTYGRFILIHDIFCCSREWYNNYYTVVSKHALKLAIIIINFESDYSTSQASLIQPM